MQAGNETSRHALCWGEGKGSMQRGVRFEASWSSKPGRLRAKVPVMLDAELAQSTELVFCFPHYQPSVSGMGKGRQD